MFGANGTVNILGKPRRIGEVLVKLPQESNSTLRDAKQQKMDCDEPVQRSLAEQQILPMIEEIFSILKAEASEKGLENGEDL